MQGKEPEEVDSQLLRQSCRIRPVTPRPGMTALRGRRRHAQAPPPPPPRRSGNKEKALAVWSLWTGMPDFRTATLFRCQEHVS